MRKLAVGLAISLVVVACDKDPVGPLLPAPQNLFYELEPSGDPDLPLGILLFWDHNADPNLEVYRVYSRAGANESFGLRGETTSPTFHDGGQPDLEYFVVAVDFNGIESAPSESVIIDERLRLNAPTWLISTSLNRAIHLSWDDNAFQTTPQAFKQYRVYSAIYSLDDNLCDASWGLEGTTVAPEFVVGALPNGSPRCYGVSAESIEGYESLWSPIRADTPRPDARNVLVTALSHDASQAGFRFWLDANSDGQVGPLELGIVTDGNRTDIDFRVTRNANFDFFLVPVRQNTIVAQYGTGPVDDLTSIDIAPETGYSSAAIQAQPGYGYVFAMDAGDQFARFGALRVTHVGRDYIIFDWSYQTDPGNPELAVGGGWFTAGDGGVVVRR